jgi:hypothetical protein
VMSGLLVAISNEGLLPSRSIVVFPTCALALWSTPRKHRPRAAEGHAVAPPSKSLAKPEPPVYWPSRSPRWSRSPRPW